MGAFVEGTSINFLMFCCLIVVCFEFLRVS